METLLRDSIRGQLKETISRLSEVENISVSAFANACRKGAGTLQKDYGLTKTQAEFPDKTFDVVYAYGVLMLVGDEEKAAAEVRRVLKPGGVALDHCRKDRRRCRVR